MNKKLAEKINLRNKGKKLYKKEINKFIKNLISYTFSTSVIKKPQGDIFETIPFVLFEKKK